MDPVTGQGKAKVPHAVNNARHLGPRPFDGVPGPGVVVDGKELRLSVTPEELRELFAGIGGVDPTKKRGLLPVFRPGAAKVFRRHFRHKGYIF